MEVDAALLSLYRVSIPLADSQALSDASSEIFQGKNPELGLCDVVGEVFPTQPTKQVHVMVQRPGKFRPKHA